MSESADRNSGNAPQLYSISLAVSPLRDGIIPLAHGHHVYALLLKIIKGSSPELAEKLHSGESVKPFTVSTFRGKLYRNGAELKVTKDNTLSLRLTFLENAVFSHFIDGALKCGDRQVEIAGLPFRVEEVETTPRRGSPVAFLSYRSILENADTLRQIDLEFITPTVFRSGGKRNNVFPEPSLVFGSYWSKWQALSPEKMDDDVSTCFDKINVTRYCLETGIWDFGSYQEVGFNGTCRFEIDRAVPEAQVREINCLADFAYYCGTGAKTTMGMGQTKRT
jgi:CRISPR-associated endoribonuclease Cas6